MRSFLFFVLLAACGSSDGGGSSGGGVADGDAGGPTVSGNPSVVLSLTIPPRTFVVQGADVRIPIEIVRDPTLHGPVHIAAKTVPAGYTIDAVDVPEGTTHGELRVAADAATTQGPLDVALAATLDSHPAEAQLPLFTRGPAGSVDTTFSADGLAGVKMRFAMELAVASDEIYAAVSTGTLITLVKMDLDGKQLKKNDLGVGVHIALPVGGGFYNAGNVGTSATLRLARFTKDLDIDTTFNGGPKTVDLGSTSSTVSAAPALRAVGDSAILFSTHLNASNQDSFYLSKWSPAGMLDGTYGSAGRCDVALTSGRGIGIGNISSDTFMLFAQADTGAPLRSVGCNSTGQRVTTVGASPDYIRDSATSLRFETFLFVSDGGGGVYSLSQEQSGAGAVHLQHIGAGGTISDTGISVDPPGGGLVVAVDANKRLITATGSADKLVINRTNADGSADSTFVAAQDFTKAIPAGSTGAGTQAIAMQGNDRFIVAGRINASDPYILRFWN